MHTRLLVTFDKDKVRNSAEARDYVENYLEQEGFVDAANARWGRGYADWYVIGGRWSGELSRHSWGKELYEYMTAIEQKRDVQVWGAHYGDKAKRAKQKVLEKELTELWREKAPKEYSDIPINRDTYMDLGYADDAMILTDKIYTGLLKQYAGEQESEYHADVEYQDVSEAFIGKKWIVVVDYHA